MKNIKTIKPEQCHLFKDDAAATEASKSNMDVIKEYPERQQLDSNECMRSLLKCKDCGQLYFYEFIEWIDWSDGNDPQHRTFIPVPDEESSDYIDTLNSMEILTAIPRLQIDWPSDKPKTTWWVKK